ncbi:MBL fold metallo-hydrolase [Planktothricoides sp. FACHB-1370]|uniref:MBL fold metallo-hydrolase n=1 Tax=Planktothricoides raciborskii FACHB-1370 TaxID=2949576 RepID=A0ABR8EKT9_9CYAN|nr:MBL fold metallo-hydrolase [Planktothricoides raciborskii]MBD2547519.1 MBL fold metallo-hydrolase [Planktothricoides raciborskii FACHB-1370]MBD2585998.1 MBL fold metallo-hydrolase [Planktothricoides raciborskii FACHB-1261]
MINRRKFLRYGQISLFAALGSSLAGQWQAVQAQVQSQTSPPPSTTPSPTPPTTPPEASTTQNQLSIKWLGHSCFSFTGDNLRVLVNPFRSIGCTAGYRLPRVEANLVLISSRLLDEGAIDELLGQPQILSEPGAYQFRDKQIQGVRTDHDRHGGRRFGTNVVWRWTQADIKILHLGGAAAPITTNQQILMGRPDVLLVPVGGGSKVYDAEEAKAAIALLNPKVVIPTQYRTAAADANLCDLVALDQFLSVMKDTPVEEVNGDAIALQANQLPETGPVIKVLKYSF